MKSLLVLPAIALLAACSITVEHDDKTGDFKQVHVSIGTIFHGDTVRGNGSVQTETRTLADVHDIEVVGPVDVDVSVGEAPSVEVRGDSNLLHLVNTTVNGDTLVITGGKAVGEDKLSVKVVVRELHVLRNAGPGDIHVTGLEGGNLEFESTGPGDTKLEGQLASLRVRQVGSGDLDTSVLKAGALDVSVLGSGDVSLGTLSADKLVVSVNGSGGVTASGTAKSLNGNVLGSGDINFEKLHADDVVLELMGSGDISVYATQSVQARVTGTGDVTIHGNPAKRVVSGQNLHFES